MTDISLYPDIGRIVDLATNEEFNPSWSNLGEPITSILPERQITQGQIRILRIYKQYLEEQAMEEKPEKPLTQVDVAQTIIAYAFDIMKIATDLKKGGFYGVPKDSSEALSRCHYYSDKLAEHLRRIGIRASAGSTWKMGMPQLHFGKMVNVSSIVLLWRDGDHLSRVKYFVTSGALTHTADIRNIHACHRDASGNWIPVMVVESPTPDDNGEVKCDE